MARTLSDLQRAALRRALEAYPDSIRSITAGDRVTLSSLHTRGLLTRRAWRGDGVSRDSAFEYTATPGLVTAVARSRARRLEKAAR